ncbi:MAG: SGNH/GDSL hydrolase family protein [Microthrixaceae bacterium]
MEHVVPPLDPRPPGTSVHGRGRRGEQPAGQLLAVMLTALVLAALVNADALVRRAEHKPLGPGRDRSLSLWHPVQDVAHLTQLHRLRTLGDLVAGNERTTRDLVTSVRSKGAPRPTVRPELRVPTKRNPLRVYVGGDSVVRDAGESFLRLAADDDRLRTALHYEIATGLARPDHFDWRATLIGDARALEPEIALLMFGGNDAQGIVGPDGQVHPEVDSEGWRAEYGRRVGAVMDSMAAKDRLVLWIGQPPMRSPDFDRRMRVINAVVRAEAATRPWVTYVDTTSVLGDAAGSYTDRQPGTDVDLRQDDGIHLSRAGADLLARHLLDLVHDEIAAASNR